MAEPGMIKSFWFETIGALASTQNCLRARQKRTYSVEETLQVERPNKKHSP
jgi:hypothetical protein